MSLIKFYNANTTTRIHKKQILKDFIEYIFESEKKSFSSINIIFCSDEFLLQLNKQYLQHDYYTDILTFDLSTIGTAHAEIYISLDRVRDNSKIHANLFQHELTRIIFHGVLHLCGYKDDTKESKLQMTLKEDSYLNEFNSFHVKQKL